jgi:integrase
VPLPKIEREEMRFLTPEIVDLAEAIHARYRVLVFVGAYSGLRMGELAGLRQSRVDLLAGAVTAAESLTEVKGKPIAGPPKTRAGGRTVGLPPFVVRELEAHLAVAQRPGSHIFTAPGGREAAGPGLSGARLWVPASRAAGLQGLRIHDLRHTAVALWIAAGATPKEVAVRGAHLGQLHPGPPRPPDNPPAGRGGPVPSSKRLNLNPPSRNS